LESIREESGVKDAEINKLSQYQNPNQRDILASEYRGISDSQLNQLMEKDRLSTDHPT
jgi:hypothetical protein